MRRSSFQREALGIAAALFAVGVAAAVIAWNRYNVAYGWVAHTSDVRLVIGRALGHATGTYSCHGVRTDIADLATLTRDNPIQQARLPALRAQTESACAGGRTDELVVMLGQFDTTERDLMGSRRETLARTATYAVFTFVAAMLAALAAVGTARWLQHRAMTALAESEERFRMLAANASDLIRVHDATGQTVYASPSCERLLGYTPQEMVAMPPIAKLGHPDDLDGMRATLAQIQQRDASPTLTRYRLRTKAGTYRWFETHSDPVHDGDGRLVRFYTTARDITEQMAAQQQLEQLSVTDELTGLLNRRGFMMLAEQQYRLALRQQVGLAVVFADVDGLKAINDALGHEQGDRAIKLLADLLRKTFRESDIVARLGGDEFAVLAYDLDGQRAEAALQRLSAGVEACEDAGLQPHRLAVSLGVAVLDRGSRTSLDDLVAEADRRMYEHKRARKGHTPTA